MKVFKVYKDWDSGGHEKGYYESPLFLKLEHAVRFKAEIGERWESDEMISSLPEIIEVEIHNDYVAPGDKQGKWLNIVYT